MIEKLGEAGFMLIDYPRDHRVATLPTSFLHVLPYAAERPE